MCTTDTEIVAEGWWCDRERFLYWRRPDRPPSVTAPDQHEPCGGCDRPVIVLAAAPSVMDEDTALADGWLVGA